MQNPNRFVVRLLDLFIIANLAFLALDVYIAHAINAFAHIAEWIPVYFSIVASLFLVLMLFMKQTTLTYWGRFGIGTLSIGIGIVGMLFHLNSYFFSDLTLKSLVYAAPFVAPLAYTGLGMLLIVNIRLDAEDDDWARWVLLIASGGWCGNFLLSVLDHAQNGFFNPLEWLPVVTSAFAMSCLLTILMIPWSGVFLKICHSVMGFNGVVGILGFGFHLNAPTHAPVFAPLLFVNLSLLAIFGLYQLHRRVPQ